jgi:hypothetical protein
MGKSVHKLAEPASAADGTQGERTDTVLPAIERRRAALGKVFGILKDRPDAPQDGLAFQLEMRSD